MDPNTNDSSLLDIYINYPPQEQAGDVALAGAGGGGGGVQSEETSFELLATLFNPPPMASFLNVFASPQSSVAGPNNGTSSWWDSPVLNNLNIGAEPTHPESRFADGTFTELLPRQTEGVTPATTMLSGTGLAVAPTELQVPAICRGSDIMNAAGQHISIGPYVSAFASPLPVPAFRQAPAITPVTSHPENYSPSQTAQFTTSPPPYSVFPTPNFNCHLLSNACEATPLNLAFRATEYDNLSPYSSPVFNSPESPESSEYMTGPETSPGDSDFDYQISMMEVQAGLAGLDTGTTKSLVGHPTKPVQNDAEALFGQVIAVPQLTTTVPLVKDQTIRKHSVCSQACNDASAESLRDDGASSTSTSPCESTLLDQDKSRFHPTDPSQGTFGSEGGSLAGSEPETEEDADDGSDDTNDEDYNPASSATSSRRKARSAGKGRGRTKGEKARTVKKILALDGPALFGSPEFAQTVQQRTKAKTSRRSTKATNSRQTSPALSSSSNADSDAISEKLAQLLKTGLSHQKKDWIWAEDPKTGEITKRYLCPLDDCDDSVARSPDMNRHFATKHQGKRYECLPCDKTFSRKDAYKRHLKTETCIEKRKAAA